MKRIAIALLVSAAALAANSARADSRFSVGINVGGPVYRAAHPTVVYAPAPAVVYAPAPVIVPARSHGYWKEVQVKAGVPERWVVSHNRWGRPVRHLEPGYLTYRTDRVWVDGRDEHGYRGGYDNCGTYSHGYDNNRGNDHHRGYDNNRDYDNRSHDYRGAWNR